ncbi:MAG: transglutaminase domain-containing protein [Phenylobacterium sp.]|uniref:transglutaminase-like domain-containing protein n=1 Tax=Phenylobacterium sp. TaxID=1871053 RepID=UPI001B4E0C2C|nr:transglutaminase-like domain-containing protein [Phenylobacterium sp.]MBP6546778.1 transglutaminase domain-containing protein [Phenylobacterium sp.]MBP7816744.1 transglutaminase domain-containing protein [Phenylobacterium sp.]MBP9756386.1 transglutaminase domain-containing protein [Phenylobacterium sp.]
MTDKPFLDRYRVPGVFTGLEGFEAQIDALSADAGAVAALVHGLLIHEGLAGAYGVTLAPGRGDEKQLHGAAAMLRQAMRLHDRPITETRAPEHRVVSVCRHFATLFTAVLRRKGVPARVRCGFANYFQPGKHLDHWVGEYWNEAQGRWVLVDAQVDDLQRRLFNLTLDPLDLPRDRFLVGGDAWRACRQGADPMGFGVSGTEMWGLVEVYGDIFQDLAALQNIELLPWGWYGLATDQAGMAETALIDQLADISSRADEAAMAELAALLAADERLRPPHDRVAQTVKAEAAV